MGHGGPSLHSGIRSRRHDTIVTAGHTNRSNTLGQPMNAEQLALIDQHTDLVEQSVDRRLRSLPQWIERDELVGCGMLGLVQAAGRFNSTLGVPFAAFAQFRIDGAISDSLRSNDPLTPRTRAIQRRIDTAADDASSSSAPVATASVVAAAAGITVELLRHTLHQVADAHPVHLDVTGARSALPPSTRGDEQPEQATVDRSTLERVRSLIESLSEPQRNALIRTFIDGRTGVDVAASMGVSPARVSQLRTQALTLLRGWLDTLPY